MDLTCNIKYYYKIEKFGAAFSSISSLAYVGIFFSLLLNSSPNKRNGYKFTKYISRNVNCFFIGASDYDDEAAMTRQQDWHAAWPLSVAQLKWFIFYELCAYMNVC